MQPRGDRPLIISFRVEHLFGWLLVFALCFIPLIFWAQVNPPSNVNTFSSAMINIGRITGLIGLVMYALNLVLATRLRILENLFGGLNRVYIAHHILGGFALIFISFHPLFLALRFVKISFYQVAMLLLPNGLAPLNALFHGSSPYHSQVLQQWAIFLGIIAFWGMVGLLLVTFFIQIPYRIWLFTHKFLGVFFIIAGLHVFFIRSDTSINMPLRYYMLAFTIIGTAAYIYRLLSGKILVRHYKYKVTQALKTGDVLQIALSPMDLRLPYQPGQFLFVRFLGAPGIGREWHPFSIVSGPQDNNLYLAIKGLGDYTKKISDLPAGTVAEIEGAYGKFSYTNYKNTRQIWIAGGIGITPFLSMARSLPAAGYEIDLYYSVRTSSELLDKEMLDYIVKVHNGTFRFFPYIGDQQKGHLSADYIEKNSSTIAGKEVYICGPPPMMDSLRKQLKAKSVPGTSIHTEEFAMS
jgi:predicted ferric reductase